MPTQWRLFRSSLCIAHSLQLSVFVFLFVHIFSLSISFSVLSLPLPLCSCWPDWCRALTEEKHSEIWHCIIMPQTCTYHSLAAPLPSPPLLSSPLLCWNFEPSSWVYWPRNNSCQACARCQHCFRTAGARMVTLAAFKPQEGLRLKGAMVHRSSHL